MMKNNLISLISSVSLGTALLLLLVPVGACAQSPACGDTLSAAVRFDPRAITPQEDTCNLVFTANLTISQCPVGALGGQFSVADTAKVRFSQGNLQYMPPRNTGAAVWRFALQQYDYVGTANTNIKFAADSLSDTGYPDIWYDLFGFGTSTASVNGTKYSPLLIDTDNNLYPLPSLTGDNRQLDWGVHNPIYNGGNRPDLWRTLTYTEWNYLLARTDNNDSLLYFHGQIQIDSLGKTVSGLFLLPDGFVSPEGDMADKLVRRGKCAFSAHQFSLREFRLLEALGVVFLPASGTRSGSSVSNVGSYGYYWTASRYSNSYAYQYSFSTGALSGSNANKSAGRSVRLVRDILP